MSGVVGARLFTGDSAGGRANALPVRAAAMQGRCRPNPLFPGRLRFAGRSGVCSLDFARFNVGDRPTAFRTLVIGGLTAALTLVTAAPPAWMPARIAAPGTSKATLLVLAYRNDAGEGRAA